MNFTKLILLYSSSLIVFIFLDLMWLGVIARGLYTKYLGHLMADKTNWASAIVFYFIFVMGILFFATIPAIKEGSLSKAILYGGLFGLVTYATYELTNFAVIKDWPHGIVYIDILWGVFCVGIVSAAGYYFASLMGIKF